MTDLDELIENSEESFFDRRNGIFKEHMSIFLQHLINEKCVLKLIMNRIVSLVLNDSFNRSKSLIGKVQKEVLIFFNSSIDKLSDNIA